MAGTPAMMLPERCTHRADTGGWLRAMKTHCCNNGCHALGVTAGTGVSTWTRLANGAGRCQGCIGRGEAPPPPPPGRPAYAQPLSPSRQVPASMAFVTDSTRHPTALPASSNRLCTRFWGRLRGPFRSNAPLAVALLLWTRHGAVKQRQSGGQPPKGKEGCGGGCRIGQAGGGRARAGGRLIRGAPYGGRGFKERARVSGERPIGATRCRQQHNQAVRQPPPPPPPQLLRGRPRDIR